MVTKKEPSTGPRGLVLSKRPVAAAVAADFSQRF